MRLDRILQGNGKYELQGEGKSLDSGGNGDELVDLRRSRVESIPIVSIEDGMAEDDWTNWKKLTDQTRRPKFQLVGDDLFVTNVKFAWPKGHLIRETANSILVKVNQIGSLSETLDAVAMAQRAGYTAVMSHRSGETEDANHRRSRSCKQIAARSKTGSLCRSDRLAKYNQLIRIEGELGDVARYAGRSILRTA